MKLLSRIIILATIMIKTNRTSPQHYTTKGIVNLEGGQSQQSDNGRDMPSVPSTCDNGAAGGVVNPNPGNTNDAAGGVLSPIAATP